MATRRKIGNGVPAAVWLVVPKYEDEGAGLAGAPAGADAARSVKSRVRFPQRLRSLMRPVAESGASVPVSVNRIRPALDSRVLPLAVKAAPFARPLTATITL